MKVYFPQWQGAGIGRDIENGAKTILNYLNNPNFVKIPLSSILAGTNGKQLHQINNFEAIHEQLSRFKKELEKEQPKTIQTIGGDCGLEIVPVSYLNLKYKNLGVIWFDAHADINKPCDSASCNFHGMPLRTLLGEGAPEMEDVLFSKITANQIHYIGLRDIDQAEQKRLDLDNIYHPKKLNANHLVQILKTKNIKQLYLHFDFDCLEPSNYDKTYYQVPDGVKVSEAIETIEILKQEFDIVGSSVLESIASNPSHLQPIIPIIESLMR